MKIQTTSPHHLTMKPMRLQFYSTIYDFSIIEIDGSSWYIDGYGSGPLTTQFQSIPVSNNILWSTNDTTQNITVSPYESTYFYVTQLSDNQICTDSIYISIENAGCTDTLASNYNPNVVCTDNSLCTYIIEGCTDENACNFN